MVFYSISGVEWEALVVRTEERFLKVARLIASLTDYHLVQTTPGDVK